MINLEAETVREMNIVNYEFYVNGSDANSASGNIEHDMSMLSIDDVFEAYVKDENENDIAILRGTKENITHIERIRERG